MRDPPSKYGGGQPEDDRDNLRPHIAAIPGGVSVGGGLRKKAAGVRPWLLLHFTGLAQVVEAGKHSIMRRTGLPARDLRILDPFLSYPSTVLRRERAIVINLEHIKAIITAQDVLLLNSRDPSVTPFVEELQRRILRHDHATKAQEAGVNDVDWSALYELEEDDKADAKQPENGDGLKMLPFEFVALEACLEAACSSLDNEARILEQEAYPALDELTTKISTLNLERVRQIKSRLVAITGRVQKVRDELEHLLDDDGDMAEMYLTEKLQQRLESSSLSSINEEDGSDGEVTRPDMDDRMPADFSMEGNEDSSGSNAGHNNIDESQEQLFGGARTLSKDSHGTHAGSPSLGKQLDVEELEMLLEAYFAQIDGTLNKLSTLREYVDDTEDYINIMLDDKQNHLLQMAIMITTATLMVSASVVVSGIFGMNIQIGLFDQKDTSTRDFLWVVGGSIVGSVFLYVIAIFWYKHKRILE